MIRNSLLSSTEEGDRRRSFLGRSFTTVLPMFSFQTLYSPCMFPSLFLFLFFCGCVVFSFFLFLPFLFAIFLCSFLSLTFSPFPYTFFLSHLFLVLLFSFFCILSTCFLFRPDFPFPSLFLPFALPLPLAPGVPSPSLHPRHYGPLGSRCRRHLTVMEKGSLIYIFYSSRLVIA